MARYRTKPVTIEAVQWNEPGDAPGWASPQLTEYPNCCTIETLEGTMRCDRTDWIIKGTEGEIYPCKDVVFKKKYEKAD